MDKSDERSAATELTEIHERLSRIEEGVQIKPSEERRFSLAQATIGGAILTLLGGIGGAGLDGYYSAEKARTDAALAVELETRRFEAELILRAVDVEDREAAIRNLRFFVAAGFISDDEGRIGHLDDNALPSANSAFSISAQALMNATYNLESAGSVCTAIAISSSSAVVPSYCVNHTIADQKLLLRNEQRAHVVTIEDNHIGGLLIEIQTATESEPLVAIDFQGSREPIPGELVFFASSSGFGTEIRQCEIITNNTNDVDFSHNCEMVQGEAGAGIFAVSDGAPLGVAVSMTSRSVGTGLKLNRF